MIRKNARWVSAETSVKEEHFRGLLDMHVKICKRILSKRAGAPYLYVDLHAGRGELMYEGREFDGSPLIARELLSDAGIRYETLHYEKDIAEASYLIEAMAGRSSTLFDLGEKPDYPVCIEPFEEGFGRWLDERGLQPFRYGLVYSDPISDQIPVDLFNRSAELLPRVDLLAYVSANSQYKRPRREALGRGVLKPYLSDHIKAVNKKHVLIREPTAGDRQQWTFIAWTNWDDFPAWEQQGFYRLDSPRGQRVMEKLDFSEKEQHERANTPLFHLSPDCGDRYDIHGRAS